MQNVIINESMAPARQRSEDEQSESGSIKTSDTVVITHSIDKRCNRNGFNSYDSKHCLHHWPIVGKVYLHPDKDFRKNLKAQVLYWYLCGKCGNVIYKWYGVRSDGSRTEPTKIKPYDFQNYWLQRIEKDEINIKLKDTRMKMFVSELTLIMSKDPASFAFLNYIRKRLGLKT